MAKLPSMQFYPGDWIRHSIGGCSLEAQGLWLRMMIIMHDADEYGELSINGKPMPDEFIAKKCGISRQKYRKFLKELSDFSVINVDKNGIIYSGRMKRDHAERLKARARKQKERENVTPNVTPMSHDSSSSSSSSSSFSNKEARALPLNADADKELKRWIKRIGTVFDTDRLPNLPRWERGVIHAIESNITADDYLDALALLVADPTRKYPVTPENVLTHVLQSRAAQKTNGAEDYVAKLEREIREEAAAAEKLHPDGCADSETDADNGRTILH